MPKTKNSQQEPLISVLMTAYNREKYISEAIESVLRSSYNNFELIIVDDCSTDSTFSIIKYFAAIDSRIRIYQNEINLGDYPNRNQAASFAKGKYLKYLDADDILYEHGLEVMVRYMEKFPDAKLGISLYKIEINQPYPVCVESKEAIRHEYLFSGLLGLGPSAAIINADAFKNIGGFKGLQYIGDTDLWLRLAAAFPIVLMNPSLNWYRNHDDQQIVSERINYRVYLQRLALKKLHLELNQVFFTNSEYLYARARINQHFARSILADLFKTLNFKRFIYLYWHSKIGFLGLLHGAKKYI